MCACLCVGLFLGPFAALSAEKGRDTGLDLPRFVSMSKTEANVRAGPGRNYPILHVLQWRNMPVKVIDEYQHWRKVELWDGGTGWLHRVLLSSARTFLVTVDETALHTEPAEDAPQLAIFQRGVIANLDLCTKRWCKIARGRFRGWVARASGYGVLPTEWSE